MPSITMNSAVSPVAGSRAHLVAEAVVSAYIRELAGSPSRREREVPRCARVRSPRAVGHGARVAGGHTRRRGGRHRPGVRAEA